MTIAGSGGKAANYSCLPEFSARIQDLGFRIRQAESCLLNPEILAPESHCLRSLHEFGHAPRLDLLDRPALLDRHQIAFLALVRLVVRVVLLRTRDDLAERVHHPALDQYG